MNTKSERPRSEHVLMAMDTEAMCARLHEIATREFPASRGVEQRIDVYLALNELLKAEDTREFVQALCEHLPALLPEFHDDLQHATAKDLIHVCLRTLSYFMFHGTLAAKVPDAQLSTFLSDIVSLLFSTQDEVRKRERACDAFSVTCMSTLFGYKALTGAAQCMWILATM